MREATVDGENLIFIILEMKSRNVPAGVLGVLSGCSHSLAGVYSPPGIPQPGKNPVSRWSPLSG